VPGTQPSSPADKWGLPLSLQPPFAADFYVLSGKINERKSIKMEGDFLKRMDQIFF